MTFDKIIEFLKSDDYRSRAIGEYYFVKDKYNKLHIVLWNSGNHKQVLWGNIYTSLKLKPRLKAIV